MRDFVRVMKAMSDVSRVSILMMLRKREMCACEMTPLLGLAQPTVSRHLRVLKDAGLVLTRREGIWINYRLPEEPESLFAAALLNGLPCWLGEDPTLRAMLERMAPARTQDRRCAFVEGRAACIDWRGEVSPCHFLWHGYECRIYGEAKRVHPTHFGNISVTPLADIWRAPEFRVFRELAQAGEYAPCGDCATGLCSDIRGDVPFERDCLGVAVPCGHCPWTVGQLMCLGSELSITTR